MANSDIKASDEGEFPHGIGKVARRELAAHGYTKFEHLTQATEKQLLAIHGVGPKATGILRQALSERGLAYADGL